MVSRERVSIKNRYRLDSLLLSKELSQRRSGESLGSSFPPTAIRWIDQFPKSFFSSFFPNQSYLLRKEPKNWILLLTSSPFPSQSDITTLTFTPAAFSYMKSEATQYRTIQQALPLLCHVLGWVACPFALWRLWGCTSLTLECPRFTTAPWAYSFFSMA